MSRSWPILGLLVLLASSALAELGHEWVWSNPLPQGSSLTDYSVVNDQVIYAVGVGGTVLRSGDAGLTWELLPTGTSAWLTAVDFTDPLTGTVVGELEIDGIILRTTDGGHSWQHQEWPLMPWLDDVDFIDTDTGVAVGRMGTILWTIDGGDTWTPQDSGTTTDWIKSVHLLDADTAVAVSTDGLVYRTIDAGQTWYNPISPTTERLESVDFGDANNGAAVGRNGVMIATQNGGEFWSLRTSGTDGWLEDVSFLDSETAVAAGGSHALLISTSGGLYWAPLAPPEERNWSAAEFTTDGGLVLTGDFGSLWQSDPTWSTWVNRKTGTSRLLRELARVSEDVAVAVGWGGTIIRTDDAGLSWTEIPSGSDINFFGVDFANEQTGMIVGYGGYTLRTDDGGLSWTPVPTGFSGWMWDIACIDADHAVAVGQYNSILVTTDGGTTWEEKGEYHGYDYHQAVYFVDALHGWTCTFYGKVFHTDDGGQTWTEQHWSYLDLQDIHFTDLLHGISVGGVDGNATIITDNGGQTWTEQPNPDGAYLNGVHFTDPQTGIAVGQGIFRTSDGAQTWQKDYAYSIWFEDICFMGSDVALAAGGGGAILRAGPEGIVSVWDGLPRVEPSIRAYPNPFNPATTIAFRVPQSGQVSLEVYDLRGRRIASLLDEYLAAGGHEVQWHGTDGEGRAVPSGVYFARMLVNGQAAGTPARMSLVK